MKLEFDSNNVTELRAVEAAVAVLLGKQTADDHLEAAAQHVTEANLLTASEAAPALEAAEKPDAEPADELDSAGQPWNPEHHSSGRAKVADGTWKKKRGAKPVAEEPREHVPATPEQAEEIKADMAAAFSASNPPTPPVPPAPAVLPPPAPQADGLVTMNDIWALVTEGKTTINVVLAAAQLMGFADLGKVAQTATPEQRAALLKELTA